MSTEAQAVLTVAVLFLLVDPVVVTWWWALEGLTWQVMVAWVVTWAAIGVGALVAVGGRDG